MPISIKPIQLPAPALISPELNFAFCFISSIAAVAYNEILFTLYFPIEKTLKIVYNKSDYITITKQGVFNITR